MMNKKCLLIISLFCVFTIICIMLNPSTGAVTLKDRRTSKSNTVQVPSIDVPKPSNVFVTNDESSAIPIKSINQKIMTQVIWEGKVNGSTWPIINVEEYSSVRVVMRRISQDSADFNVDTQLSSSSRFAEPWAPIGTSQAPIVFFTEVYDIPGENIRFTTAKGDCWVILLGRK
jgi:hypothetical protein